MSSLEQFILLIYSTANRQQKIALILVLINNHT